MLGVIFVFSTYFTHMAKHQIYKLLTTMFLKSYDDVERKIMGTARLISHGATSLIYEA